MFWSLPPEYLADPQQQNSYSYARNNPIVLKDPSGKCIWDACAGEFITAVALFSAVAPYIPTYIDNWQTTLSISPYIGDFNDAIGFAIGYDVINKTKLSTTDRAIYGSAMLSIGASGKALTEARAVARGMHVIQYGAKWSSNKLFNSAENLLNHFTKHKDELAKFGITTPQGMYDEAINISGSVDNVNVFKFPSINPNVKNGTDIYDAKRNLLLGVDQYGNFSTLHEVTDPKKFSDIQKQVSNITNNTK